MDRPLATCTRHPNTPLELKRYVTFCYWWCSACKDEPQGVRLHTVRWARGEKGEHSYKADNDVHLSGTGVWKLTYTDGSVEWYERGAEQRTTIISGDSIRSATRIADGDLPSRKPLQLSSTTCAGEGASEGRHGVRAVSDTQDSLPTSSPSVQGDLYSGDAYSGDIPLPPPDPVWRVLYTSHQCVEYGKVPPDDSL
jgi:hypothetical protein